MEAGVDVRGRGLRATFLRMSLLPGGAKRLEPFPPAFGAGTVPGCQSGCFVQEEEFGVTTWRHHLPLAAPKLQHTHEPSLSLPLPPDAAFIVMENATIAHECSPLRRGNDLTKWIHTILSGHRHACFNGSTADSVQFCFSTQATCFLMASFSSGKLFLDIP